MYQHTAASEDLFPSSSSKHPSGLLLASSPEALLHCDTACVPVEVTPKLNSGNVQFKNLAGSGSVPISMKLHPQLSIVEMCNVL